jgi:hypothetical protein
MALVVKFAVGFHSPLILTLTSVVVVEVLLVGSRLVDPAPWWSKVAAIRSPSWFSTIGAFNAASIRWLGAPSFVKRRRHVRSHREPVQLRILGDEADGPAYGPFPIKGALRAAQDLDPLEVIGSQVELRERPRGGRNLVEVHADQR